MNHGIIKTIEVLTVLAKAVIFFWFAFMSGYLITDAFYQAWERNHSHSADCKDHSHIVVEQESIKDTIQLTDTLTVLVKEGR